MNKFVLYEGLSVNSGEAQGLGKKTVIESYADTATFLKLYKPFYLFFFFVFIIADGCVPLQQQAAGRDSLDVEGFVGPVVIDEEKFYQAAFTCVYDRLNIDDQLLPSNNNVTYESTIDGEQVYILNCRCLKDIKIVQNKLVVTHTYGGGESNRESTKLLWTGRHYQNSKGEYIVDLILYSVKIDPRRALLTERKVLDIEPVQVKERKYVWINLLGYDQLIRYDY